MRIRLVLAWTFIGIAATMVVLGSSYLGYQSPTGSSNSADISSAAVAINGDCANTIEITDSRNDNINKSVFLLAYTKEDGEQAKIGFFNQENQLSFTIVGTPKENQDWYLKTVNQNNQILQEDYLVQPKCNQNYYITIE